MGYEIDQRVGYKCLFEGKDAVGALDRLIDQRVGGWVMR